MFFLPIRGRNIFKYVPLSLLLVCLCTAAFRIPSDFILYRQHLTIHYKKKILSQTDVVKESTDEIAAVTIRGNSAALNISEATFHF